MSLSLDDQSAVIQACEALDSNDCQIQALQDAFEAAYRLLDGTQREAFARDGTIKAILDGSAAYLNGETRKQERQGDDQPPVIPPVRFVTKLDENLAAGPSWFVIDLQTLFMGVAQRSYGGKTKAEAETRAAHLNRVEPLLKKPVERHEYTRSLHPDWYAD